MKEYTIRIFNDNLEIYECKISAKNMFVAEDEALKRYNESGLCGRITYLTTEEKI